MGDSGAKRGVEAAQRMEMWEGERVWGGGGWHRAKGDVGGTQGAETSGDWVHWVGTGVQVDG